jgi:nucleotide-binding universal stress UspA family protein
MPFKTVLAVVGGKDTAADLQQAISLCAGSEAHLSVLALQVALSPTLSDYPVDTDWLDRRHHHQHDFKAAAEAHDAACAGSGISYDFASFYDEPVFLTEELTRRAFYADLITVGPRVMTNASLIGIVVNGGLFDAMSPVLLLPEGDQASLRPKRIMLGWNNKIEAIRAVRESMDMLMAAEAVDVAVVDPTSPYADHDGEPGAELATFLARHGVNVTVDQIPSGGRPVEDVLNQRALEVSADMLVLGAYGHARWRQRIFGGVTSSMMKGVRLPTLLVR